MPIHPDFQKILDNMIKQHGEEKGKQVYNAWLRKTGYDDTKPMTQQKTKKEAYSWTGDLTLQPETTTIKGKALHPIKTVHPEEWPSVREYLEDELIRAARTLKDKPLLLDHSQPLRGSVVDAEYEDGAIEFVAQLDDSEVLDMIRQGEIKHCSVEFEWKTLEKMNGVAPRGIHFTGLSLLKSFEPGDPLTTVEVWEAIVEKLRKPKNTPKAVSEASKTPNEPPSPFSFQQASRTAGKEQAEPQEFILYTVRDPVAFLEERFSTAWIDLENGVQAIFGRLRENPENLQPQALLFTKAKGWTIEKMHDWLNTHPQYLRQSAPSAAVLQQAPQIGVERVWDREYINDLPDSAFAIILPGGEKDETDKTVPRSLRKLPHHRRDGSIDLPHLRNGNIRVAQSNLTEEQKREAQTHLDRHKKAAGVGEFAGEARESFKHKWREQEEVEFEIAPEPTIDELIESVEKAIEIVNANFDALEARVSTLEKAIEAAAGRKLGEAIIPSEELEKPATTDFISKREVLTLLPERVPRFWGYGPTRLVQRLKQKLQSPSDRE